MTTKSPFPCVLAAVLATTIVSVAGQVHAGGFKGDQVGADAVWIMHMDFDAMRESGAGKMMHAMWLSRDRARKKMDEVLEKTGMDPRKDLDSMTIYDDRFKKDHGVVLIKFKNVDPQKLLASLREKHPDVKESTYNDHKLFTWEATHGRRDDHNLTGALFGGKVIVLSRESVKVMKALDVLGGKAPKLAGSSPLTADAPAGTIFLVRATGMADADLPMKCPVLKQCHQMSTALGQEGDTLFVNCQLQTQKADVAANTAAVVDGFRALVTLRHGHEAEVIRVLGGLKAEVDDTQVSIHWRATGKDVMTAAWKMKSHHRGHRHGEHHDWWKKRRAEHDKHDSHKGKPADD